MHGGSTPTHVTAAVVTQEENRARSLLQRLGEPEPIRHPVRELLDLAAEISAWRTILRERVDQLATLETEDTLKVERERAAVLLYERSLDRLARLLVDLTKLDLQARRLSLDEQDAKRVMAAISDALTRAGLSEHEAEVRRHFATALHEYQASDDERASDDEGV